MSPQQSLDVISEAKKAALPVVVTVASTGFTLQDWVYVATIVYVALQAGWLVWKWWRAARTKGWKPVE